jgi:hypothetical protein
MHSAGWLGESPGADMAIVIQSGSDAYCLSDSGVQQQMTLVVFENMLHALVLISQPTDTLQCPYTHVMCPRAPLVMFTFCTCRRQSAHTYRYSNKRETDDVFQHICEQ